MVSAMKLIIVGLYVGCCESFELPVMGNLPIPSFGGKVVGHVANNAANAANRAITTGGKLVLSPEIMTRFMDAYQGLMQPNTDPQVLEAAALAYALEQAANKKKIKNAGNDLVLRDHAKDIRNNLLNSGVSNEQLKAIMNQLATMNNIARSLNGNKSAEEAPAKNPYVENIQEIMAALTGTKGDDVDVHKGAQDKKRRNRRGRNARRHGKKLDKHRRPAAKASSSSSSSADVSSSSRK